MCSFNGTEDLQSIDSATRIHIYVFDGIHLLTHSGREGGRERGGWLISNVVFVRF